MFTQQLSTFIQCFLKSTEKIKEMLNTCFQNISTQSEPVTYAWHDSNNVTVNSIVNMQGIQIICCIVNVNDLYEFDPFHSSDSSITSDSQCITYRINFGDSVCASLLYDKIKCAFCKLDNHSNAQLQQNDFDSWWGTPNTEVYPGSMNINRDKMQSYMELSCAWYLHQDICLDSVKNLALCCISTDNRRLFIEMNGDKTLEELFSISTSLDMKICALSILYECLKDSNLSDIISKLKIIGTNGSRVKTSLMELSNNDNGLSADSRAKHCLELLVN
jgi:hypothetical protein